MGQPRLLSHEDQILQRLWCGHLLSAPLSWWEAVGASSKSVGAVNGCGPGELGSLLVPDTLWGLSIKPACDIHDWCFAVWYDQEGFGLANNLFNANMQRIVLDGYSESSQGWLARCLLKLRLLRANKYRWAVKHLGAAFYFDKVARKPDLC